MVPKVDSEKSSKLNSLVSSRAESKKQGPGGYNITRLFSIIEDKEKGRRRFASIPNVERTILGVISKVFLL